MTSRNGHELSLSPLPPSPFSQAIDLAANPESQPPPLWAQVHMVTVLSVMFLVLWGRGSYHDLPPEQAPPPGSGRRAAHTHEVMPIQK